MGRHEAFREVYARHYDAVLRYAWRRCGPDAAPVAAAEVFEIAWRRWPDVPCMDPLPWLYRIARGVCLDHLREGTIPWTGGPVGGAWARMPEPDREILALVAWEGLDLLTASRVTRLPVLVCAARLLRARRRLAGAREGRARGSGGEAAVARPRPAVPRAATAARLPAPVTPPMVSAMAPAATAGWGRRCA